MNEFQLKSHTLQNLTLRVLLGAEKPLSVNEIVVGVALLADIDLEQRPTIAPNSKRTDFSYKLAWVRTYLKREGLIERIDSGVWQITSRGREKAIRDE